MLEKAIITEKANQGTSLLYSITLSVEVNGGVTAETSAANLYVGAGGQVGGNQSAGVGVVGAEVSVAKNIVLFADAKIPFAETGAETFGSTRVGRATYNYGSGQGYNVTGTVGVGIKF